jgi:hypothetical protein
MNNKFKFFFKRIFIIFYFSIKLLKNLIHKEFQNNNSHFFFIKKKILYKFILNK